MRQVVTRRFTSRAAATLVVAAALLIGCGSGDDSDGTSDVSVTDVWARASAAGQTTGAVYFDIEVSADDTLTGVSVPGSVADRAEIHEETTDDAGLTTMHELTDGLALTGGASTSFAPGGVHVMLVDLADPLVIGETFDMTLDFAGGGPLTVTVTVAETAP